MLAVLPLPTGCPMVTTKKGRRYLATVAKGEATSLQGEKSDVILQIKEGCPKRAYLMEVRTDLSNFGSIIPDDECFISPIVEVLAPAETSRSSYTLRIRHCLDEDDDKSKVKVRMVHENRNPAVVEVPKGNAGALYYDIDDRFIELHTAQFTKVICTICQQAPYHCRGRINSFWFANFDTQPLKLTPSAEVSSFLHVVEIRPYFGGVIRAIVDFQKVINSIKGFRFDFVNLYLVLGQQMLECFIFSQSVEATVNLRYVTQGILKRSRTGFNLEVGQIRFSLKVEDPVWKPGEGLEQWDPNSRTFTEVSSFCNLEDVLHYECY